MRHPDDYYRTPHWCTQALLDYYGTPTNVLDPCCGDGGILEVCHQANRRGVEIDAERARMAVGLGTVECGDWLSDDHEISWSQTIVMNPPFKLAMEFLTKAIESEAAAVYALLRLGYLGSQRRCAWWRAHPPTGVLVLSTRPSFTFDGKTDGTEYAWFSWTARATGWQWALREEHE